MVVTAKGAGMTYRLKVEREGKRSDYGCNCNGSRDDVQSGGGEQWQEVRSWLRLQREQDDVHTGGGKGGKRSEHGCNYKGSRDDIQSGGGEGEQEVRSQLQLQREQG